MALTGACHGIYGASLPERVARDVGSPDNNLIILHPSQSGRITLKVISANDSSLTLY